MNLTNTDIIRHLKDKRAELLELLKSFNAVINTYEGVSNATSEKKNRESENRTPYKPTFTWEEKIKHILSAESTPMLVDEITTKICEFEAGREFKPTKKAITMAASRLYKEGKLEVSTSGRRYLYSLKKEL